MSKTLHRKPSETKTKKAITLPDTGKNSTQLTDLVQEMRGVWQDAANDLMQPRPEAIAQLLKKVLH